MNTEDVIKYEDLNRKLAPYQWFVSPYYCWMDLNPVVQFIEQHPLPDSKRRLEAAGRQIAGLLMRANLNYTLRAVLVYEGYRVTPNLSKFSHLIEAGLFEFYKLNFITCIAVWIPTVEGIIRSMVDKQGHLPTIIEGMRNLKAKQAEYQPLLDVVVTTISPYLRNVFYKHQRGTEETPTYNFNRHLFGHQYSNAPMYCRANCLRLINIFDSLLAIDFIVEDRYRAIFDGQSERVKVRERYYEHLMRLGLSNGEIARLNLLGDHREFNVDFYYYG